MANAERVRDICIGLNLAADQPHQVIFLASFMAGKLTVLYFCAAFELSAVFICLLLVLGLRQHK